MQICPLRAETSDRPATHLHLLRHSNSKQVEHFCETRRDEVYDKKKEELPLLILFGQDMVAMVKVIEGLGKLEAELGENRRLQRFHGLLGHQLHLKT